MRLRQLALVAADLDSVVGSICAIFGIEVAFRDPGVEIFGLRNAVMPVGDTFLEVVSPVKDDTAAGRYRERRGGDCGYMALIQSDDYTADRSRIEGLGVRIVWSAELDDISGMHLHPRDIGGPLLSLDEPKPPAGWRWAGRRWTELTDVGDAHAIAAAEIADTAPADRARRWGEILDRPAHASGEDWAIDLDQGQLRFVEADSPSAAGLTRIDLNVRNPDAIRRRAEQRGVLLDPENVEIGGVRFHLRPTSF